ncbi:zinc finger MYND domain-containing protein 12-like [Dysidea avara]|uniref:zinc finger MYND domain-containing protein 12-like n=1 Tax=Dysidea avara TaxID=196820 RepID=UPI003327A069
MLNPLANPKGVKIFCELCPKPAYVQCTNCRAAYYCNYEHQQHDLEAIHHLVCHLLAHARKPLPHANSSEERLQMKHEQQKIRKDILDITLNHSTKLLHEGRHDHAAPSALQALKISTDLYGNGSIDSTPAYFALAEANIGLGQLKDAEQYLSQAQWVVLQTSDCAPSIKSRLHRDLGLLFMAQGDGQGSKKHFAEDIYHSSLAYGPHHRKTVGGYFHLGNVFLSENKPDVTLSLHDQVIQVWNSYLHDIIYSTATPTPSQQKSELHGLDAAGKAEALHMLHRIRELREQHTKTLPPVVNKVYHTLAMLHYVLQDFHKAYDYVQKALDLSQQTTNVSQDLISGLEELMQLSKVHLATNHQ